MALSTLYSPFNFNPSDTQTKTGSFTIPTGKFAMVTNYQGLTIDTGSGAVEVGGSTTNAFTTTTVGSGNAYTASAKERFWGYIDVSTSSGGATVSFEDKASTSTYTIASTSATASYSGEIWLNEGDKIDYSITTDGTVNVFLVPMGDQSPVWVTDGDVLDGEVYTLTIYDVPA